MILYVKPIKNFLLFVDIYVVYTMALQHVLSKQCPANKVWDALTNQCYIKGSQGPCPIFHVFMNQGVHGLRCYRGISQGDWNIIKNTDMKLRFVSKAYKDNMETLTVSFKHVYDNAAKNQDLNLLTENMPNDFNRLKDSVLDTHAWNYPLGRRLMKRGTSANHNLADDDVVINMLPPTANLVSQAEEKCFSVDKIFWPQNKLCYKLLSQGPCKEGEWLVLVKNIEDKVGVTCQTRNCPCLPEARDLCEVYISDGPRKGCHYAKSAFWDGFCSQGEQLLVNPFGEAICGCIKSPVHVTWPANGKCYPLYSGDVDEPCPKGQILKFNSKLNLPFCSPSCNSSSSFITDFGGNGCYKLGERGPCPIRHVFKVNSVTLEPNCEPRMEVPTVRRVFDLFARPQHRQSRRKRILAANPMAADRFSCTLDFEGKCQRYRFNVVRRKRRRRMKKQSNAFQFVKWLNSFMQNIL